MENQLAKAALTAALGRPGLEYELCALSAKKSRVGASQLPHAPTGIHFVAPCERSRSLQPARAADMRQGTTISAT